MRWYWQLRKGFWFWGVEVAGHWEVSPDVIQTFQEVHLERQPYPLRVDLLHSLKYSPQTHDTNMNIYIFKSVLLSLTATSSFLKEEAHFLEFNLPPASKYHLYFYNSREQELRPLDLVKWVMVWHLLCSWSSGIK